MNSLDQTNLKTKNKRDMKRKYGNETLNTNNKIETVIILIFHKIKKIYSY